MKIGLIGKKIGMTREFFDSGISVPVTVLSIEKGRILTVITKEKRGYDAIQVGFGKIKTSKLKNQMKGLFAKKATEPKKFLKEFRVDVKSKTIGKGFAGVMKRHNFSGLRASHGVSVSHRSHGSTGQNQDPGKVFKGKKMAGHMGNKFRTIQNLEVIKSDLENNLIFVKGSVPGSKNSLVLIQKNSKKINKITTVEKIQKKQVQSQLLPTKTKQETKTPEKKAAVSPKPKSKETKK